MTDVQARINRLLRDIALMEGGKSHVKIGDLRQVIKILAGYEAAFVLKMVHANGDLDLSVDELMEKWGNERGAAFTALELYKDELLERGFFRVKDDPSILEPRKPKKKAVKKPVKKAKR